MCLEFEKKTVIALRCGCVLYVQVTRATTMKTKEDNQVKCCD